MSTTTSVPLTVREQGINAAKDLLCGSVAGTVSKIVEYPLDTVKVRLQSQAARYKGSLDCLRQSVKQHGLLGLYRGISAPLLGSAAEISCIFMSYSVAQNALRASLYADSTDPLPTRALIMCGAASGAFTSLVLNPVELLKCKMQVQIPLANSSITAINSHPGPLALIASIYKYHGLLGFWHGQMGTFLREMGGTAAYFGTYEIITSAFRQNKPSSAVQHPDPSSPIPIYQQMTAGALAGVGYNFICYPADTIKSRMQIEEVGIRHGPTHSFWQVGRLLWQQHGLSGLYRGCGMTLCRSAPSSALIFVIYEAMRKKL